MVDTETRSLSAFTENQIVEERDKLFAKFLRGKMSDKEFHNFANKELAEIKEKFPFAWAKIDKWRGILWKKRLID